MRDSVPVAVDGDGDDEQHGHDDGGNDDVEGHLILPLVVDRAHHPLPVPELDLWGNRQGNELSSAQVIDKLLIYSSIF